MVCDGLHGARLPSNLTVTQNNVLMNTLKSVRCRDPGIGELAHQYNKLCGDMQMLIQQGRAPCNSIALLTIQLDRLFSDLDMNDDIWLDVGLSYGNGDEDDESLPPLWLSNENVQAGIRALLDQDCCREEHARIITERSAMQVWFNEEWHVIHAAIHQGK